MKKPRAHSDTLTVIICRHSCELAPLSNTEMKQTDGNRDEDSDGDARTDSNCCLSVVLIFEEARVL